jgi:hypothetical protein
MGRVQQFRNVRLFVVIVLLMGSLLGMGFSFSAPVTPSIDRAAAAAVEWYSKAAFASGTQSLGSGNTGLLTIEYDVTPLAKPIDGVMGYADTATTVTDYPSLAAIVRMNSAGTFDARNGGAYAALTTLAYSANTTYHLKIVADLPSKTYSVWVNGVQIAANYAFRSDAPLTDDFGQITLNSDLDNQFKIVNHTISTGTGPTPTPAPGTPTPIPPTPTPTPPPSGGNDRFGVKMLYSTKSNGETWFLDMTNATNDPRFDPQDPITRNADGSWKMKDAKVRMNVFTSTGYDPAKVVKDHSILRSRGYMQAANDWKNVEITGYVKLNAYSVSDENFAWYARGGKHTGEGLPDGCEGSAYKGDLHYNGRGRFAKEQWHVKYFYTADRNYTSYGSIRGRWVGFKTVMYNTVDSTGKTVVRLEDWIDENANNTWKLVETRVDSGGWGDAGEGCNGAPDQIIIWGGPIATFRWDDATDVDFKWLSVREIQP